MMRTTLCLIIMFLSACQDASLKSGEQRLDDMDEAKDQAGVADMLEDLSVTRPDLSAAQDMSSTSDASSDMPAPDMGDAPCQAQPLQAQIEQVQPMTGIVVWADNWAQHPIKTQPGNLQLEYAYLAPGELSTGPGTYDWSKLDALLTQVSGRGHQLLLRFHYAWPGRQTGVPAWLKARPDYQETSGMSEGQRTWFPDWSSQALMDFHTAFFEAFAARYDQDPRLAFLQVGFGLWAEYHIYDGPNAIGQQLPTHAYQKTFLQRLSQALPTLHWSVSIDAGDSYYAPFSADAALRGLRFGLFDDSFMHKEHDAYNASMWRLFGHQTRSASSPAGGELSYYTENDQRHALDKEGLHGRTFEALAQQYQITYMIGDGQPQHQSLARIKEASQALGYKLKITAFERCGSRANIEVLNEGIAPLYYDAWLALGQDRASASLKGLMPGQRATFTITTNAAPNTAPTIEGSRLVPGQRITYSAQLP